MHSSPCPSATTYLLRVEDCSIELDNWKQRSQLVGSGTSYIGSQGAGAISQLTSVPSPATWHTWGHCWAGEVWYNLWAPQHGLVLSPLFRFPRLTMSDTRMKFQQQNLKYTCFSNEMISTHADFSSLYSDFSTFFFKPSYLSHCTH